VYASAGLVAAVAAGLAGLFWYVQAGTFVGTETKRLSMGDRVVDDVRISVMQGRPRLPLFGFPRPVHRTIINSTDIDQPLLADLGAGIQLSSRDQWHRELPHLLRPYHRGKYLHFLGAPVHEVIPHLKAGLDSDNPVERLRSLWLLARIGQIPSNWRDKLD